MRHERGKFTAGLIAAVAAVLLAAGPASASGLETILQDDAQLLHRPEDQLRQSLEQMRVLGVDRVRVTAGWSVLTRDADSEHKPRFDSSDPAAYEQERWRNLDRLVVLAREYGLRTMIDIAFWAPRWASRDPAGHRGRTHVDANEFARFATAVARRYSGSFVIPRAVGASRGPLYEPSEDERYLIANYGTSNPPAAGPGLLEALGVRPVGLGPGSEARVAAAMGTETTPPTGPLPRVDVFTLWNEPNHSSFMRPQWVKHGRGHVPHSPHAYRVMVHAAYPGIKNVQPDATVLIGSTSAMGSHSGRGTGNVPPMRFVRELACVDRRLRPLARNGCSRFQTVPGDGFAHHPYTMTTEPDARSRLRDDVPIAELPRLARLLDRLATRGRFGAGIRNLWITEYGYETNPPVEDWIYSQGDQAYFLTWAEYLAWRVPSVRSFAQFLLRDLPPGAFRVGKSKRRAFGQWQSGLLFEGGKPKLAAHTFRAGLHVQATRGRRLRLWGRLRLGAGVRSVAIDKRDPRTKRWSTLETVAAGGADAARQFSVDADAPFMRFATRPGGRRWRYRVRYLNGDAWVAMPLVPAVWR